MSPPYPSRIQDLAVLAALAGDDVLKLCRPVIDDPDFATWSGSIKNRHHYGAGGLQYHTFEVVVLCLRHADFAREEGHVVDDKVLMCAAMWHDMAKVRDYSRPSYHILGTPELWENAPHHRLIHHISASAIEWNLHARACRAAPALVDHVTHCILSHHAAHGSPIMPKTREAWILHLCDCMCARVDDCGRVEMKA